MTPKEAVAAMVRSHVIADEPVLRHAVQSTLEAVAATAKAEEQAVGETLTLAEKEHGELLERLATTNRPAAEETIAEAAPPVEIEMRVTHPVKQEWGWEAYLAGQWITVPDRLGNFYVTSQEARHNGDRWLAAVSDQLGVKLVAKWEETK